MKKQIRSAFEAIEGLCGKEFSKKMEELYVDDELDLDTLLAIYKKIEVIKMTDDNRFEKYFKSSKNKIEYLGDLSDYLGYFAKFTQLTKVIVNEPLKGFTFGLGEFKAIVPKTNIEVFETLLLTVGKKKPLTMFQRRKELTTFLYSWKLRLWMTCILFTTNIKAI